ncbi:MAG: hypothetical protein U9Q07_01735 [Planctomycetota bacterium]|nr:hypothetical protein [Planctomycetota bacterium]
MSELDQIRKRLESRGTGDVRDGCDAQLEADALALLAMVDRAAAHDFSWRLTPDEPK